MLNVSKVNPYIRVAMNSVLQKNHEIKRRIIFDYELIYIADGEFVLNYDGVDYVCKQGQFIFIRPGVSHSFLNIKSNLNQPHIHFDITHMSDSAEVPVSFKDMDALDEQEKIRIRQDVFCQYPKTPFVHFLNEENVLKLFYGIIEQNEDSALAQKGKLIQIIGELINDNFFDALEYARGSNNVEELVKEYIDAGQGMTSKLDDIAKQFNYSKFYLERCFKKYYGVSIVAYRNTVRLERAKKMLKSCSVSDVSKDVGFSSIYAFSRAFKNKFGISPMNYKKQKTD